MFYFDEYSRDVWSGRPVDFDIWVVFCEMWGIRNLAVINNTELKLNSAGRENITIYEDENTFFSKESGPFILLDPPKNKPNQFLTEHKFNEKAWYCIGPCQGWKNQPRHLTLGIEQEGLAELHAPFVASVLCWEYYKEKKGWR